jgi:nucleotidyltransferase AbiEii toxin of type IV toxin-antitoxin system
MEQTLTLAASWYPELMPKATRPSQLSPYAERALQALADAGLGHRISVRGALGLQHYLEYRFTNDVDAWWEPSTSAEDRSRVIQIVESALREWGETRTRQWGEVVSVELRQDGKVVFSFQIASRSAQLEPTERVPWTDVSLDSLPDLIASKMVALVERGAPRDFRDIHALCAANFTSASECWALWRRRQEQAGSDPDPHRARLAVETHLARITQHRPLESIADASQREEAERVRTWFAKELLDALLD